MILRTIMHSARALACARGQAPVRTCAQTHPDQRTHAHACTQMHVVVVLASCGAVSSILVRVLIQQSTNCISTFSPVKCNSRWRIRAKAIPITFACRSVSSLMFLLRYSVMVAVKLIRLGARIEQVLQRLGQTIKTAFSTLLALMHDVAHSRLHMRESRSRTFARGHWQTDSARTSTHVMRAPALIPVKSLSHWRLTGHACAASHAYRRRGANDPLQLGRPRSEEDLARMQRSLGRAAGGRPNY